LSQLFGHNVLKSTSRLVNTVTTSFMRDKWPKCLSPRHALCYLIWSSDKKVWRRLG